MDRIDFTQEGGYAMRPEDTLDFWQSAIIAGVNASQLAIASNVAKAYYLQGATYAQNGANHDVVAGWMMYKGQLYQVDTHSVAYDGGATYVWVPYNTADTGGLDPFTMKDGSTQNIHRKYRLKLEQLDAQSDYIAASAVVDLRTTEWTVITGARFATGITDLSTSYRALRYRKHLGCLEVEGGCEWDDTAGSGADVALFSLPEDHRPNENVEIGPAAWVVDIQNSTTATHRLTYVTSGNVTINNLPNLTTGQTNGEIHIRFSVPLV